MKTNAKVSIVSLVVGIVLGAVGATTIHRCNQPSAEAEEPDSPSLRELSRFASENIQKEKPGDGSVDEELLKRHALELTRFLRGDATPGFTRTAERRQTSELEEIRIRVFDDNRLFGGGYDFDFRSRDGRFMGIRLVPGQ